MSLSIFDAARDMPGRLAIISAASGEHLTFSALADRVSRLIAGLRARGLDGSASLPRVAVVGTNSLESVCRILSLIEMGEPFVLIHPRLTERERAAIFDEVHPAIVLDRDTELDAHSQTSLPSAEIPEERCLALIYTSGTEGRAKGAILSRRAFIASARASEQNIGWHENDRWLACIPLAHVGALSVVTRCLLARRTIVIDEAGIANVENLARTISRDEVTIASLVPAVMRRLLDLSWTPPPSLRAILLGGAAAPPSLLEEARRRRIPVLTTYGLTEACSQVTTQRYGTPPSPELGAGEPLPGYEVRIAGGEIQVRSRSLLSGYFPLGAHPDPILPDGFLRTGDIGRIDEEGRLHVLDRRTDLIVTGGENVYPREIEQVLLEIPGIASACVFGVPDETWGQIVAAAVVAVRPIEDAVIAEQLDRALASFKRPRRIAFLDELPLTGSEKIDRTAVRKEAGPLLRPLISPKPSNH